MTSSQKARILDVWAGQDEIDWTYLKSAVVDTGLIHGIIIRQGQADYEDTKFAAHVQGAHDIGLPAVGYHVTDPRIYTAMQVLDENRWPGIEDDPQMVRIRKSLLHKLLYGLAVDVEVTKEYNGNVIPDAWLSKTARHCKDMIDREYGDLYEFRPLYSADWYMDGYSPSSKVWLHQHDLWWAKYIQPKSVTALLRWEDLEQYLPDEKYWPYPECTGIVDGRKRAILWQWTGDTFVLPGIYGAGHKATALDFNLFDGTADEWYELIGFTPASDPVDPGDGGDGGDGGTDGGDSGNGENVDNSQWEAAMLTEAQRINALLEEELSVLRSLNSRKLKDMVE